MLILDGIAQHNVKTSQMLDQILSFNPFKTSIQMRLADTDSLGHVNNAAFVKFLEYARTEWHVHVKGSRESLNNWDWILGSVSIRFIKQAKLSDSLIVYLWSSKIGNKSWEFSYTIVNQNEEIVSIATSTQIGFDYDLQVTIPIPTDIRLDLEKRKGPSAFELV